MRAASPVPPFAVGFLTVVEHEQHGLYGGYLLLNAMGRPLEFHCTAPVKPNRAQQILYGPALAPFLYGEQIGQTLIAKSAVQPQFVCTDLPAALAVRAHVALPVVLVRQKVADEEADAAGDPGKIARLDAPHAHAAPLALFRCGPNCLAVEATRFQDRETVTSRLEALADGFDLLEPFSRIREAIEEAQRSAK